jgi:hypothetical protein
MMNKNIADVFETFAPSEKQKERIYQSIVSGKTRGDKKATPKRVAFACAAAACIVLAAVAAILLGDHGKPDNAALVETRGVQTGQPSLSGGNPSATECDAVFTGFVFTAYRPTGGSEYLSVNFEEEAEQLTLNPDVKVLLAKYSPLMSSVPGLPFTIDIPGASDVDTIRVSVDGGALCEWDQATGVVTQRGASAEIAVGGTIYWSPFGEDADPGSLTDITMTVEAVSDGAVPGRQEVHIIQDETGCYYAVAGEPETM